MGEEELQLVLALSKSEADEKEAAKKKATSDLLAGYTNGVTAPAPVKEEERREAEQQQPELEKYLDREYWEQQSRGTAKAAMAPQPHVEREQVQVSPPSEFHRAENEELDDFTMSLRTQLEIFVNRMKSNSSRGRPIATDSSVQTLFMNVMTMHGKLVKYIAEQEEERVMYEGLQDKLNQVKDARAALDGLSPTPQLHSATATAAGTISGCPISRRSSPTWGPRPESYILRLDPTEG